MARTSNEFGGGEIVPAIEAITGIQAPVMADFQIVPNSTVIREDGSDRRIQNQLNNLKASSGIERIPFNGIDELDTEQGTSFANAFFQATFGSTAERTVIVNLTNGNGASGAVTLTFTPAGSGSGDYITAFNTAWNASINARLSEYSATLGAFIDNSSITANIADASRNITTLTIVDSGTSFTVTTSDFSFGQSVHALNTGDSRIRFVGSGWQQVSALGGKITTVIRTLTLNDYVEITFFGTALNLLVFQDNTTGYDWRATVDGGVESGNLRPSNPSAVLQNNGQINIILPTASNLSPGVHTVRIRNASNGGGTDGFTIYGCEFINANAGITQQSGADFDGRVEALNETTFPIKPNNVTVPSADRAGNAAVYANSTGLSGIQGARVLNYLTSGGQFKQVFNTADAVIATGGSTPVAASIYTLRIDGPGSGTGTTTSTITIPDESTTLSLETFGAGGDGGNGVLSGGFAAASGGGGGGGAYTNASYTKTGASGDTLAIVVGAGSEIGNVNNTTITGGGALSGSFTVNAGIAGVGADPGNSLAGTGGAGGTVPANANITGFTVVGTPTLGAGNNGTNGEIKFQSAGDGNVEGGQGGLPGNQSGTVRNGGVGVPGTGGTNVPTGGAGEIPGGGGGGGGASFSTDGPGGQGGNGRVTITIRARSGLTESSFGSNVSFPSTPVSDGLINLDPGSAINGEPLNTFGDASHGNQEVIRRINFREFGANSEFATSPATASFTLDDGTTTLVSGNLAGGFGTLNGTDYMTFHRGGSSDGDKSIIFTFVGTGLDLAWVQSSGGGTLPPLTVSIDGFSIGIIGDLPDAQENSWIIRPIVSGLAYGTHTVSIATPNYSTGGGTAFGPGDFIIYGPKKPEIPTLDAGSLELSDYNVMADYDATTSGALGRVSKGTLGKTSAREFLYTGSIGILATTPTVPFGTIVNLETNGSGDYTFYGTGIEYSWTSGNNNEVPQALATLDGNTLSTTNFSISLNGGTRAGTGPNVDIADVNCVFAPATGLVTRSAVVQLLRSILQVSVLELGVHTIRLTDNGVGSGSPQIEGAHVITPIHINEDTLKVGSEGLNNLTIDPVVEEDEQVALNLGEAKAWLSFNTTNLGTGNAGPNSTILSSYNIAAVLQSPAGSTSVIQVYFDKPFKGNTYVVSGLPEHTNGSAGSIAVDRRTPATNVIAKTGGSVQLISSINNTVFDAVFHGELIDE